MAKGKGGKLSFKNLDHGKKVGSGTEMALSKIGGKGKKSGQVSGHIDPWGMQHDAKGHEKGSRGPYTKASTGNSKSKN